MSYAFRRWSQKSILSLICWLVSIISKGAIGLEMFRKLQNNTEKKCVWYCKWLIIDLWNEIAIFSKCLVKKLYLLHMVIQRLTMSKSKHIYFSFNTCAEDLLPKESSSSWVHIGSKQKGFQTYCWCNFSSRQFASASSHLAKLAQAVTITSLRSESWRNAKKGKWSANILTRTCLEMGG